MEKLSLKKKLLIIRLYTEGLSYNEIAIRASVGKGTVANVVSELKSGRFPEFGDLSEQLELIRELAIDLKRTRLTPIQAAVGVSVLSRLQELGVEPGEIEGLSALCRTLNADGIDIQSFIRAALAFEEEREHTGLSVEELEMKVQGLEESVNILFLMCFFVFTVPSCDKRGLCYIRGSNCILFPSEVVESLIKRKDLPDWETNIEGANVKDNELLLSCPFGVHFTLWIIIESTDDCLIALVRLRLSTLSKMF